MLENWMRVGKLKLNLDKTRVLLVQKSVSQGFNSQPALNGVAPPLQEQRFSTWGVLLESSLLNRELAAVVGNGGTFAQLSLVQQLWPYLSQMDLTTAVYALVTSRLDYCNTLCMELPWKTVQDVPLVQSTVAQDLVVLLC